MRIKVTALTASQRNTLSSEPVTKALPSFVVETGPTWAILNGSPAECVSAIQGIMDGLREEGQGQGGTYKTLVSVRNKIEVAASSNAATPHVKFIMNGANTDGDVPPVLSGVPVVKSGETNASEVVTVQGKPLPRRLKFRDPQLARDNFRHQMRDAPTEAAREYWKERVDALPVS